MRALYVYAILNKLMNFEIIVKSNKDGKYIVLSPSFPGCESEGATMEEAVDRLVEKISDAISGKIKKTLKQALKEIIKKTPRSEKAEFSGVLTKFPISLN